MKISLTKKIYLSNFVLSIVILELIIGGSGRIFSINNYLTLRMLFFVCLVPSSILLLLKKKHVNVELIILVFGQMLLLLTGTIIGLHNDASWNLVFTDVKQQLYFFMIIYFFNTFNSYSKVNYCIKVLKTGAMLLTIGYLSILILIYLNIIDFSTIYKILGDPGLYKEFRFRGTKGFFFYKSFIYLDIALVFYLLLDKHKKIYAFLILAAVYLTYMRGLIIALGIIFIIDIFLKNQGKINLWKFFTIFIALGVVIVYIYTFTDAIGSKTSDVRTTQIIQVFNEINPFSFLFGHGFGVGVEARPVHMEITYLELFHKQGLLGLSFWLFILYIITRDFTLLKGTFPEIYPLYLGVLIVYIISFMNPFLINSIGMSYILIIYSIFKYFIEIIKE